MRVRDARGETGPLAQSRARATYLSDVSVALLLSASESAAAPASPMLLLASPQRKRRVRVARGETGPPAQSRTRATYSSAFSVALLLSATESEAAPASPIWLSPRLQRGEEGQGCSWRDRAAGTEQGARDLHERRQRRVYLERVRERRGARVADLGAEAVQAAAQAAARIGGSGMLVARQGRGEEQGARDLRKRRQRRVDLERLRERRGARGTDLVALQAAARRGGSAMLVARQGR
jgi:hypothetical protein